MTNTYEKLKEKDLCMECGNEVLQRNFSIMIDGVETPVIQEDNYKAICKDCLGKGWVSMDTKEAQEILGKDKKLNSNLYRVSPFYKFIK